jgi:methyltransferase (TIGR00027 family)
MCQVVILACGLDTRPQRLSWPPGVVIYELDQPGVVEFKVETLARLGVADRATVRSIGVDLREDWAAVLRERGFDPTTPTAWIAEALLPYLPAQAQGRVLETITSLSPVGSRLAVDWYLMYGVGVEQPESDEMERPDDGGD